MRFKFGLPFPRAKTQARAQPDKQGGWRGLTDLQTLVLIALLFAVPIGVLFVYAIRGQTEDLDFAARQLRGHELAEAVGRLVTAVPWHRDLATRLLAGDNTAEATLRRSVTELRAAIQQVDLMTGRHGEEFGLSGQWVQLRAQWTLLESEYNTLSPSRSVEAHTRVMQGISNFLALAGERSGLLLDSKPQTYFLISADTLGLPALNTQLAMLRTQAYLGGREVNSAQRELVLHAVADARAALEQVGASLDSAYAADAESRSTLQDKTTKALDAARRILDQADAAYLAGQPAGMEPNAWFTATTQVIEGLEGVHQDLSRRTGVLLGERVEALERGLVLTQGVSTVFVLFALLGMLMMGRRLLRSIRQRQMEAERLAEQNRRNQTAILRLMDEMALIAEGDLTAEALVNEDITGAIADSVNMTVGELRKVVANINNASEQVTAATDEAQGIASRLLAAAQRQVQDINHADSTVQSMTRSITEVSATAGESAEFARSSIATTERGNRAVQESIVGMNEIRQQIQDTSKRIKRLGESSQEIGEIVDLISDITEQTNVLALNAAIQAASAGEAGRGFTVVAEEVQHLAERSAEATKQIAALVRTIQADTQEAVAAMEKSTHGVVEGARLSDAAGQALQEIEEITRSLAELMQSIAESTQSQVDVAEEVRRIMREVLGITGETADGTERTAMSVAQLAALAQDLKSSVTRFKVA
jgi:twitching motility protein PilJ